MVSPSVLSKEAEDIGSFCTVKEKIISFRKEVEISSLVDEKMVVLEACSLIERVNMTISPESSPFFYFYQPLIKDMKSLFPFPLSR